MKCKITTYVEYVKIPRRLLETYEPASYFEYPSQLLISIIMTSVPSSQAQSPGVSSPKVACLMS